MELRTLNVKFEYIKGERNRVADGLSRTIFGDEDCRSDEIIKSMGKVTDDETPRWIWKDGIGGYEEMLKRLPDIKPPPHEVTCKSVTWSSMTMAGTEPENPEPTTRTSEDPVTSPKTPENPELPLDKSEGPKTPVYEYHKDPWYKDIWAYLTEKTYPKNLDRIQTRTFEMRARNFRIIDSQVLVFCWRGAWKRCICRSGVSKVLFTAHDQGGHFAPAITIRRIQDLYWPRMAKDVVEYIQGCLKCAKYGPALRSQTLSTVSIGAPMVLLGMDYIGPFPESHGYYYVLHLIDYFSRFTWAYPTKAADQSETIRCLKDLFVRDGIPVAIYYDGGSHFVGQRTETYLSEQGVLCVPAPIGAKKSVGMIEKANDIYQRILKKVLDSPHDWDGTVLGSTFEMNHRQIVHLGYAPAEISRGFKPAGLLESLFPSCSRTELTAQIQNGAETLFDDVNLAEQVVSFMVDRTRLRSEVLDRSDLQKDVQKQCHDLGIHQRSHTPGQLVMLYDAAEAGKKLRPSWRGPFVVTGQGGDHGKSYTLKQPDGTIIKRSYHGDSLKPFKLREGYLCTGTEEAIPAYQNLRAGKSRNKLPKAFRE